MLRRSAVLLVVLAIASLGGATAVAASKTSFKPGLYLGKTSQGEPVKLKVLGCGTNQCLQAPDNFDIIVKMPCPSLDETSEEAVSPADNLISKSGRVDGNQEGFSKVIASFQVAHNGSLTGKIRSTETLEDGARCDSGTVTLTAKIGGSTG